MSRYRVVLGGAVVCLIASCAMYAIAINSIINLFFLIH